MTAVIVQLNQLEQCSAFRILASAVRAVLSRFCNSRVCLDVLERDLFMTSQYTQCNQQHTQLLVSTLQCNAMQQTVCN
jgi:hypothetical protein